MQNKPYRYEFKYYIDNKLAQEISDQVKIYLDQDQHAKYEDGSYDVTSLYFDSFKNTDYWEKTGGNIRRKKIRLRIYEPYLKDSEFVNFEIKHKIDMMNRKTKIILTVDEAKEFIEKGAGFFLKYDWGDNEGEKEKIMYYLIREKVKPGLFVTYKRRAFMSPEKNWRITFDSCLRTCRSQSFDKPSFLHPVHKNATIMEVKYQYVLQFWLQDIIRKYGLQRDTFSKYERSLEEVNVYNPMLR